MLKRTGREVAGIEVKAAASVNASDMRGLRKLRERAAIPSGTPPEKRADQDEDDCIHR